MRISLWLLVLWCPMKMGYAQEMVSLPGRWSLFAVDALHHLYGWDPVQRALYKLWAPRYDSITRIGGAPGEEGFLGITALAPLGNQQLYVLDADGQKIMLLGTNLQPLQQLSYAQLPREVAEGYPILLTAGRGGELYLLLRETQEVVKIDAFGRVLLRFGGKLYGTGSIAGAGDLYADGERIYVVDTVQRLILMYDSWGNFLYGESFPDGIRQARGFAQGMVFWEGAGIIWQSAGARHLYETPEPVRAVWVRGGRLYWLGGHRLGWFLLP